MWSSSISTLFPSAFIISSPSHRHHNHVPLRHGEFSHGAGVHSLDHLDFQHLLHSHKLDSQTHDETKSNDRNCINNLQKDYSIIRRGKIYIEHDFITSSEITALQEDIVQLKDSLQFQPSGLSNRVPGDQNLFDASDRLTCTITSDLVEGDHGQYSYIRSVVEEKLQLLKHDLERSLSPSPVNKAFAKNLCDEHDDEHELLIGQKQDLELELAEMYYSISPQNSILPRHNDERHEDTKGDKGWIHDTRRSVSWLIYLNGDDWSSGRGGPVFKSIDANTCEGKLSSSGSGGELRAYCRECPYNVQCGSHDGNIQIGWLRLPNVISELDDIHSKAEFEPIFLDSWVKVPILKDESTEGNIENDEDDGLQWRSMSALYRVKRGLSDAGLNLNSQTKLESQKHTCDYYQQHQHRYSQRQYLSQPFGPDSPSWPSEINLEPSEFVKVLASQLSNEDLRSRFIGTETIHDPDIKVVDVVPRGGTLVLFDSVAVPHEVLEVMSGDRLAIAGWFHELQQPFPNWYGT